jgi:hypothetical protein
MKIFTLAAGVAVGYVLGSRAGREKYEEIAAAARRFAGSPTVQDAKAKTAEAVTQKIDTVAAKATPRPPRKTTPTTPPPGAGEALV